MVAILQAIILGIIEGFTEFLPISSTGHLIVMQDLIGFADVEEIFTVVVQVGAILAVLWLYRHDLAARLRGLKRRDPAAIRFWQVILFGTIPAGVIGLLLEQFMENLYLPAVVASMLIVGAFVLWFADHRFVHVQKAEPDLGKITTKQAWIIGFGQSVALVPGVSRSGATIVSGLFVGLDRATATAFSFYLAVPVLFFASAFKLIKYPEAVMTIPGGVLSIVLGMTASFITALFVMKLLLRYISRHNFTIFVWYRIILGVAIFAWLAIR